MLTKVVLWGVTASAKSDSDISNLFSPFKGGARGGLKKRFF